MQGIPHSEVWYPDADIVHVGLKNNADHETAYLCFGGFIEPLFHFLKACLSNLKIEPNEIPSNIISSPAFPESQTIFKYRKDSINQSFSQEVTYDLALSTILNHFWNIRKPITNH